MSLLRPIDTIEAQIFQASDDRLASSSLAVNFYAPYHCAKRNGLIAESVTFEEFLTDFDLEGIENLLGARDADVAYLEDGENPTGGSSASDITSRSTRSA